MSQPSSGHEEKCCHHVVTHSPEPASNRTGTCVAQFLCSVTFSTCVPALRKPVSPRPHGACELGAAATPVYHTRQLRPGEVTYAILPKYVRESWNSQTAQLRSPHRTGTQDRDTRPPWLSTGPVTLRVALRSSESGPPTLSSEDTLFLTGHSQGAHGISDATRENPHHTHTRLPETLGRKAPAATCTNMVTGPSRRSPPRCLKPPKEKLNSLFKT